jgi:hypothetical protein
MSDTNEAAYEAYRAAIRSRVCSVCLDQKDDGSCGLQRRACALEVHLPAMVNAVLAVQSDRMEDYETAMRALVCVPCGLEDGAGRCQLRDLAECALSTYLYLVVDAVADVRAGRA